MADVLQTVEADVKADATKAKSWLLLHERLIITLVVIAALVFSINKVLGYVADHDKQQANQAAAALQAQVDENKQLAAQVTAAQSQNSQLVIQLQAENAQLAAAVQQRTVVLQQQQAVDKTLPMPDLGNRWAQLESLPQGSLTASTDGITVTPDAARTTVTDLEQVPVLKANLSDTQTQNTNLTKELDSANNLNGLLTTQVSGLNVQIADQDKACKTEITSLKADARKSKLHWFGAGFGVGYVAGLVTKIF